MAAQEYVLFCSWLEDAGYSDLCTSFRFHLSSEYESGRYPYPVVEHHSLASILYVGENALLFHENYSVPVNAENIQSFGARCSTNTEFSTMLVIFVIVLLL